jgi:hypothetical protein
MAPLTRAAAEALPPAHRLAWLIGRLQVPELGDPGPLFFGGIDRRPS